MEKFNGTYKFAIEELPETGRLRLAVSQFLPIYHAGGKLPHAWQVTEIIEGPCVFIINRLTAYYDDTRRLRKVKH